MSKKDRQKNIKDLIIADNRGWRKAELARLAKVHRSTVGRDIEELIKNKSFYLEKGKIYLDSERYLSPLNLDSHEMIALQQSAVFLLENEGFVSPHLASAVEKISSKMALLSPEIKQSLEAFHREINEKKKLVSPKNRKMHEKINKAWMNGELLDIHYLYGEEIHRIKGSINSLETRDRGICLQLNYSGEDEDIEIWMDQLVKVKRHRDFS
ncbi:MAG: hypothetical protein PF447_05290 [Spirochaetaceae bacterium]|jgi:predicted DNA-binding transcriptional regulator YafY|nr:hypothetical protein [Spirochaetaceae bacterium]